MKHKGSAMLILGLLLGFGLNALVGCPRPGSHDVTVREPSRPGEATINYTPPPEPNFDPKLITNYAPMIRRMITPKVDKVTDDVYLAVGYALGNVAMIVTDEGLILIDGTDNPEVAARILADFRKITDQPIRYLVITHFHPDHTGGARVYAQPGVKVIATEDFIYWNYYQNELLKEHHRRARTIQSGNADPDYSFEFPLIKRSPVQIQRDAEPDVPMPDLKVKDSYSFELGGKKFTAFHTWGETNDHLALWMPDEKILFCGDLYYHSFPNLSTPMLESRPVQGWIDSLDKFIDLGPEVLVPQHSWAVKGADVVREHLTNYRDAVDFVHRETVRCINEGKTVDEAVAEIHLPERLAELDYLQEAYGRVDWSVRGIYHGYQGWYDGRGTGLYPLPPSYRDRELVDLAGGANNILARAVELQKNGEHQLVLELCDVVIKANPDDRLAHRIKAESDKQLAFSIPNLNTLGFYRSAYAMDMKAAAEGSE